MSLLDLFNVHQYFFSHFKVIAHVPSSLKESHWEKKHAWEFQLLLSSVERCVLKHNLNTTGNASNRTGPVTLS